MNNDFSDNKHDEPDGNSVNIMKETGSGTVSFTREPDSGSVNFTNEPDINSVHFESPISNDSSNINNKLFSGQGQNMGSGTYPGQGQNMGSSTYSGQGQNMGSSTYSGQGQNMGSGTYPGQGQNMGNSAYPGQGLNIEKKSFYKRHKGIIVFGIIVLSIILITIILVSCTAGFVSPRQSEITAQDMNSPYIAVLNVEGTIGESADTDYLGNPTGYIHAWSLQQIDYFISDSNNKALMLYINSPGGSIYETAELYSKIKEYKETTGRPVYTYMAQYAASGGYYIAADSDKIFANQNTMTGSIGVYIGPFLDISGLMEKLGVGVTIVRSAENKAMGNSYEPLTEEQKAIYQSMVDEYFNAFVSVVSEGRNMTVEQVKAIADGRSYTATQALSNGLIDEIDTFDKAKIKMQEDLSLQNTDFFTPQYVSNNSILDLLFSSLNNMTNAFASANKSELESAVELAESNSEIEISYMMNIK